MAVATWKNIEAPGIGDSGNSASALAKVLTSSAKGFQDILKDARDRTVEESDADIIERIRGLGTEKDITRARNIFSDKQLESTYGPGNYTPGLGTTALDARIGQLRLDEEYKRAEKKRLQTRFALERAEQLSDIESDFLKNIEPHKQTIAALEEKHPKIKGILKVDEKTGALSGFDNELITPEISSEFIETAHSQFGRQDVPRFTERLKRLEKELPVDEYGTDIRKIAKEHFKANYLNKDMPNWALQRIERFTKLQSGLYKDQLKELDAIQKDLEDSIGKPQTQQELDNLKLKVKNNVRKMFPESHMNFLWIGDAEGGTELEGTLDYFLNIGVRDDEGKLHKITDPTIVYSALTGADYESSYLDEASISIENFRKNLLTEMRKRPAESRAAQRAGIRAGMQKIRNQAKTDFSNKLFANQLETEDQVGIINPRRNDFLYSESAQRTFNEEIQKEEDRRTSDKTVQTALNNMYSVARASQGLSASPSKIAEEVKKAQTPAQRLASTVAEKEGKRVIKQLADAAKEAGLNVHLTGEQARSFTKEDAFELLKKANKVKLDLKQDPTFIRNSQLDALTRAAKNEKDPRIQKLLNRAIRDFDNEKYRLNPAVQRILRQWQEEFKSSSY